MIISDLNHLEAVEGSAVVGGIYLGSGYSYKTTSLYVNENLNINKYIASKVDVKGNTATAEAEAQGDNTVTQSFAFTTPYSSNSTSIAATN
ncbi:MAG: hypothetical protein KME57_28545 [Scytonema hyalinum WJT4-NPBG1]|jgi:hypothetical protein|nr:hypothetical protein [Scytonema hyalinum WJT4-NPBG1]